MNRHSVHQFIKEHYPQYYSIETYPADKCAVFCETHKEWGILSNMAATLFSVEGVTFKSCEHLFQMMKFNDKEIAQKAWNGITAKGKQSHNIKMTAKSYEPEHRRADWGSMIVDALKYAMMQKYEQCEAFRQELERSKGLFIIEKQANPNKPADTWSAKLEGDQWVGPNLTGRLLMELRDNGRLEYHLPDDALSFIETIKQQ